MSKVLGILYTGILIILILSGSQSLLLREVESGVLYPGFFVSLVIFCTHIKKTSSRQKLFFLIALSSSFFTFNNAVDIIRYSALRIFPMATAILLLPEEAMVIKKRVLTFFTYLIFISLIVYFLYLLSLVPTSPYLNEQYYGDTVAYLLCYSPAYDLKFCGFCVEPGYFSLLCVSLLCLDGFNFRNKKNLVLLVSILLSFSLGGYLLLLFGWGISLYTNAKGSFGIKKLMKIIVCFSLVFFLLSQFSFTKDMFEDKIVERLEFDSEKGIAGNNRQNAVAELFILDIVFSNKVYWGIGTPEYLSMVEQISNFDAASCLVFVVRYGLIYTILLLVALYLFTFYRRNNRKLFIPFYIVFMGDFIQHGLPFGSIFILYVLFVISNEERYHNYAISIVSK